MCVNSKLIAYWKLKRAKNDRKQTANTRKANKQNQKTPTQTRVSVWASQIYNNIYMYYICKIWQNHNKLEHGRCQHSSLIFLFFLFNICIFRVCSMRPNATFNNSFLFYHFKYWFRSHSNATSMHTHCP